MTLLYYLKPSNSMIVGPHEWAPEFQWGEKLVRKKRKTKKEKIREKIERITRDDDEIILSLLKLLDD